MNSLTPNKQRVAVSNSAGVHVTHHASPRLSLVPAVSAPRDRPSPPSPPLRSDLPQITRSEREEKLDRSAPALEAAPSPIANPNRDRAVRIRRTAANLAPARLRKPCRKQRTTRQQKTASLLQQSIKRTTEEAKGSEDALLELEDSSDSDGGSPPPPPPPKILNDGRDYCDIDGIMEQPIFVPPTVAMVALGYLTLSFPFLCTIAVLWAFPVLSSVALLLLAIFQACLLYRVDLTGLLKYVIRESVPNCSAPVTAELFLRDSYVTPQRPLKLLHCAAVPFIQALRLVFLPCAFAISGLLRKVAKEDVRTTDVDERLPSVQSVEASNVCARLDMWNCISPSTMLYTTLLSSQTVVQQILSRIRALSCDDRDKLAESISARVVNVHIRASMLPDVQRGSAKVAAARASASDASDATVRSAHRLFYSQASYFVLGLLTSLVVLALKASTGSMAGFTLVHACLLAPVYEELLKTACAVLLGTSRYIPSLLFGVLEFALFVCSHWASPVQRILPLLMHMYVGTQNTMRAVFNHAAYNIGCSLPFIIALLLVPTAPGGPPQLQLGSPINPASEPIFEHPHELDICEQFAKECHGPPFLHCAAFINRAGEDGFEPTACPCFRSYMAQVQESEYCSEFLTFGASDDVDLNIWLAIGRRRYGPTFQPYMCHPDPCDYLERQRPSWFSLFSQEKEVPAPRFCQKLLGSSVLVSSLFLLAVWIFSSARRRKHLAMGIRFACGYRVDEVRLPPPGQHSARIKLTKKFYEPTPTRSDSCSLGFTFSRFVPAFPDFCHPATALHGVLKRFCKTPPKPSSRQLRSLRRFAERYVRKHYTPLAPDVDTSVETWLEETDYPEWRKRDLLQCWRDKPWVVRDDFVNKSFIKREFYTDFKAARGINSRSDTFKCFSGPYFKLIENQVYDQPCFDGFRLVPGAHTPFIKHIPSHLRPQFLSEMFEGCDGPFYETDYSEFEKHFTPEVMSALELVLYKHMLQNHPDVYDTIKSALRGTNKCCFKAFIIRIAARRMSGDMCTSLGNGFSNLMLFKYVAESKGGTAFGVVEGDDALFKSTVPLFKEDFSALGFDIKIMSHIFLHLTSFCGMSFSSDGILLRDPLRVMPKFGWSFSPRRLGSARTRLALLKARALSLAYESPRCPIIHALAKRAMEVTEGIKPIFEAGYHHAQVSQWLEKFPDVMQEQLKQPPSLLSRLEFAAHFGISVELQLRVEEIVASWDGGALDHPVITELFNHNESLQAFSERYVDTNLDALTAKLEVNRQ